MRNLAVFQGLLFYTNTYQCLVNNSQESKIIFEQNSILHTYAINN